MSEITFPALVKFNGCDELIVLTSADDWHQDSELQLYVTSAQDVLIDSTGKMFQLCLLQQDGLTAQPLAYAATTDNVIELIQAHFANEQSCCASKIQAKDVATAISRFISSI